MKRKRFRLADASSFSNAEDRFYANGGGEFSTVSGISREGEKKSVILDESTCREEVKRHPYLKNGTELVIPFDAPDKYHWWAGRQSIFVTLLELEASDAVIEAYVGKVESPQNWRRWQEMRTTDD